MKNISYKLWEKIKKLEQNLKELDEEMAKKYSKEVEKQWKRKQK